jgi:hypothetical protein
MADKLKQDLVSVTFAQGEQPSAMKLNGAFAQMENAIEFINESIGDLHSRQTHLTSGGSVFYLSDQDLVGPNIGRLAGSAGWLNPRHPGRIRVTDLEVIFAGHQSAGGDPATVVSMYGSFSHLNRKEFVLPYLPILMTSTEGAASFQFQFSWTGGSWTIGAPGVGYLDGSAKAANRVSSINDLDSTGDYHVSGDGVITLYDGLDNGEGFKVTYSFDTVPDSYDGASLNVLPDFSQTTVGSLCTVTQIDANTFDVALPTASARRSWTLSSWYPPVQWYPWDNAAAHADPLSGYQLTLPYSLTSSLSTGDTIPSGFIQLYDASSRTTIANLTFTYRNTTTVRVTGASLTTGSDRYRIVVVGTNAYRTLDKLREDYYWHDHSGRLLSQDGVYMGHRISHMDLLNQIDEGSTQHTAGFQPSMLGPSRNPHPQYLHRRGYKYDNETSADERNWHNAMIGPLLMAGTDGTDDGSADSERMYFSGPTAASLFYDQSEDALKCDISYLKGTEGVVAGDNAPTTNGLKWIRFFGSTDAASPSSITGITKPSDYTTIYGATITTQEGSDIWYTSNSAITEGAGTQLAVISVDASGATITVNVAHGTDFDNQLVYGIIFYV